MMSDEKIQAFSQAYLKSAIKSRMVKEFLSSTSPVVNLTVDENHPPSASISASLPSPHESTDNRYIKFQYILLFIIIIINIII